MEINSHENEKLKNITIMSKKKACSNVSSLSLTVGEREDKGRKMVPHGCTRNNRGEKARFRSSTDEKSSGSKEILQVI